MKSHDLKTEIKEERKRMEEIISNKNQIKNEEKIIKC
jgi:hypothetical protein